MKPIVGVCAAVALGAGVALKLKKGKKCEIPTYDEETVKKSLEKYTPEPLSYHLQVKGGEFKVIVNKKKGVITSVQLDDVFYSSDSRSNEDNSCAITNNSSPQKYNNETLNIPYAKIGQEYECIDFSSLDFLSLSTNPIVLSSAAAGLGKYGPGACGPRGFYGSLDIFIELEEKMAKYLGFQGCALYSYELLLFPSVIPTLITKKKQPIIVPVINHKTLESNKIINSYKVPVSTTIRNGCKLGYGTIIEVEIDIEINLGDLSTVSVNFKALEEICKKYPKTWIVLESGRNGVTFSVLEDIFKIAHKHRCLVCADCTYLKETYIGKERSSKLPVDVALVGLGTGFGGVGGLVLSTSEIIDRQRLGGRAYVFSAAPPPPCICGVLTSLDLLGQGNFPNLLREEIDLIKHFVNTVSKSKSCYIIDYTEGSPLITIGFKDNYKKGESLRQMCEELMMKGFLVNPHNYDKRELAICIKAGMNSQQIDNFISVLD